MYRTARRHRHPLSSIEDRIALGWYQGAPPLGYEKRKTEWGYKAYPCSSARLVCTIFALATFGYCCSEILRRLDTDRVRQGENLDESRIRHILRDRFYIGDVEWNGVKRKGGHRPIISRDLFELAQVKLDEAERL